MDKPRIQNAPASYKSAVWINFGFPIDESTGLAKKDETICKLCFVKQKYNGQTTNMAVHLKRHHADIRVSESPSTKTVVNNQTKISNAFAAPYAITSGRAQAISKKIAVFLAADMRPYSLIDTPAFKDMISALDPRYKMPSRTHFSEKLIPELYNTVRAEIELKIKSAEGITLTTDGWTSRATESFVTITAHFINASWIMDNVVLQTRPLHEAHTGVNIAEVLLEAKEEWKLGRPHEVLPIVTDSAANMIVAVKESGFKPHVKCFAHTLNLAVQRGLKVNAVSRLLGRIRRVVSFFHRSSTAAALLKANQKLLHLPQHKLITEVQTRWNSAFDMLDRYLEQQGAVVATLVSPEIRKKEKEIDTLSADDLANAEDVVKVLKPLKTMTTLLCSESTATVSMILPLQNRIIAAVTTSDGDSNLVTSLKQAIHNDISGRYKDESYNFLLLTSALDPRFKSLPFISEESRLGVFTSLITQTCKISGQPSISVSQPTNEPPMVLGAAVKDEPLEPPPKKRAVLDELLGEVYATRVEPQGESTLVEQAESEVGMFRGESSIPLSECPLKWWKDNAARYPLLAKSAKVFLCTPATSVPSERVFSTAGDIVTAQRANLTAENVDKLIFLKKNMSC